jgi:hypothetical protein
VPGPSLLPHVDHLTVDCDRVVLGDRDLVLRDPERELLHIPAVVAEKFEGVRVDVVVEDVR